MENNDQNENDEIDNEESDDEYKEERNHNTDDNKDNTNQGVEEMADMIDKLQEDFEEIRRKGEEIMEPRRSTREKREVEWYTYTQQMKYNEEQYNVNHTRDNKLEVKYSTAEAQYLALVMEHIDNNLSLGQQYIVQKGLRIYSKKGEAGIKKEMKQMND